MVQTYTVHTVAGGEFEITAGEFANTSRVNQLAPELRESHLTTGTEVKSGQTVFIPFHAVDHITKEAY